MYVAAWCTVLRASQPFQSLRLIFLQLARPEGGATTAVAIASKVPEKTILHIFIMHNIAAAILGGWGGRRPASTLAFLIFLSGV